ncbi:MAG: hypothetical protein ACPGUV_10995 [Polyangiales bacterium]
MHGSHFEEADFFRAIDRNEARALLIGRRALVALGLPLLTADYDFWVAEADLEHFAKALEPFDLFPNKSFDEARRQGRLVFENDEHIDVLCCRSLVRGNLRLDFDAIWQRRRRIDFGDGVMVYVPCTEDIIATKRFSGRPKDIEDIRLLEAIQRPREEGNDD